MVARYKIICVMLCLCLSEVTFAKNPKKYNILILSNCSLRTNRMGLYGAKPSPTPLIDQLAAKSFVFNNAIADMSWSNVSGFLSTITNEDLGKYGYKAIGNPWSKGESEWQKLSGNTPAYYFRTPNTRRHQRDQPTLYNTDLELLRTRLLSKHTGPFLIEVHNKTVHMPYGQAFYGEIEPLVNQISNKLRIYAQEYLKNIEKYPERIPLVLFLSIRSEELTKKIIKMLQIEGETKKELMSIPVTPSFVGILNNSRIMGRWKSSKYFEKDIEVIKAVYDLRLRAYDKSYRELLSLYGNSDLQKNTVIIYTGDHGEAFFEHGYMIHGETVYDEMIRFPLFIHFPGQRKEVRISKQFYQQGIKAIVDKIMKGELTEDNFEKYIDQENNHPFIVSRNCANTVRSIRHQNEWKYIWDLRKDKRYLYNLEKDPAEKNNVFDQYADIAAFLDEKLIPVSKAQIKNKMIHNCSSDNE